MFSVPLLVTVELNFITTRTSMITASLSISLFPLAITARSPKRSVTLVITFALPPLSTLVLLLLPLVLVHPAPALEVGAVSLVLTYLISIFQPPACLSRPNIRLFYLSTQEEITRLSQVVTKLYSVPLLRIVVNTFVSTFLPITERTSPDIKAPVPVYPPILITAFLLELVIPIICAIPGSLLPLALPLVLTLPVAVVTLLLFLGALNPGAPAPLIIPPLLPSSPLLHLAMLVPLI